MYICICNIYLFLISEPEEGEEMGWVGGAEGAFDRAKCFCPGYGVQYLTAHSGPATPHYKCYGVIKSKVNKHLFVRKHLRS